LVGGDIGAWEEKRFSMIGDVPIRKTSVACTNLENVPTTKAKTILEAILLL